MGYLQATLDKPVFVDTMETMETMTASAIGGVLGELDPTCRGRYATLIATLGPLAYHFAGRCVLDFGCGKGMSATALIECGAKSVVGVDALDFMMEGGNDILEATGYADRIALHYIRDTRTLPFRDGEFGAILCNAVFEHIPQPRDEYITELWRVLSPGGMLIINETPNKYLPVDFHTLHLPFTNWLPSALAHWIGTMAGRFDPNRTDWQHSGWRGAGYYELLRSIPKHERRVIPELANARHRALNFLGLPTGLFDPYPLLIITKTLTGKPNV